MPEPDPGMPDPDPGMVGSAVTVPDPPDPPMVVAPAATNGLIRFIYDTVFCLTKLNGSLLDLSLALLHGKGDGVEVHSVATELDILGSTTALLVAADHAALHVHSVSVQHKGEVTRARLLPNLHPLTGKGVLKI